MSKFIYDSFMLIFDAILFIAALSFLLITTDIYKSTEKSVNNAISIKTNITTTYEKQDNIEKTKITGTAVANEILTYDDTYEITINGSSINNIVTPTREPFLEYIKKYDVSLLYREISNTNYYIKECNLDHEGNIVRINYDLVAN